MALFCEAYYVRKLQHVRYQIKLCNIISWKVPKLLWDFRTFSQSKYTLKQGLALELISKPNGCKWFWNGQHIWYFYLLEYNLWFPLWCKPQIEEFIETCDVCGCNNEIMSYNTAIFGGISGSYAISQNVSFTSCYG